MRKQLVILGVAGSICFGVTGASAADLMAVYQQALRSDPTFQAAYSTEMSEAEAVPENFAALLPQISATGSATWSRFKTASDNYTSGANHTGTTLDITTKRRTTDLNLSVTQTLFDFTDWMNLSSARASVKAAKATYNAAAQSLMQRVAQAYFNVLEAQDILRYTLAEKRAFYQEYQQARERLKVGVTTITDVDNAKASYDGAIADYITAKNDLANKKEDLIAITGQDNRFLAALKKTIPLITPRPRSINDWVATGIRQNWDYTAARYTALAAHRAIYAASGGHMPTLTASAEYDNQLVRTYRGKGRTRTKGPSVEVGFSLPIFSGGSVNSAVRKALADYETATHEQEQAYRTVVNDTRNSYRGVQSGISTVRAQRQVVVSNRSSLDGTQEGYKVGTRTMVDVLLAEKALYQSQKNYAAARYNYVMSLIALKQAAGTLSEDDLQKINKWLYSSRTHRTTYAPKPMPKKKVKASLKKLVKQPVKSIPITTKPVAQKPMKNQSTPVVKSVKKQ